MKCNLDKYENYSVTKIVHDQGDGGYMLTLENPPATCPDGKFLTHNAEVKVQAGTPSFGLRTFDKKIVITVPNKAFVLEQGQVPLSFNLAWWGGVFGLCVVLGLLGGQIYEWFARRQKNRAEEQELEDLKTKYEARQAAKRATANVSTPVNPTNVYTAPQQNTLLDSALGSFAGTSLANSLERPSHTSYPSRSSDDDSSSSGSSYSSDSGSSYSSDSGSSYSSDSGSSYSSDSGSSFGSDSGSSFSSDSGSSFSSD